MTLLQSQKYEALSPEPEAYQIHTSKRINISDMPVQALYGYDEPLHDYTAEIIKRNFPRANGLGIKEAEYAEFVISSVEELFEFI